MDQPNRIISASRRTDLPGFHADVCAERLRRLRKPVHSVFFWTRHPRGLVGPGLLADFVRHVIENPFVHLTVTGLGGSALEPRAPTTREVLDLLDPLIERLRSQPRRLLWRFDPLLRGVSSLATFGELCRELGGRGVERCIISYPSSLSLKGPLEAQYRRHGLSGWTRAQKRDFALRLAEVAARHDLKLFACNQPGVVADCGGAVRAASCISAGLAAELHPRGLPLSLGKDPAQRRNCNCAASHDIGRYDDRCGSGCVYCYSRAGGP